MSNEQNSEEKHNIDGRSRNEFVGQWGGGGGIGMKKDTEMKMSKSHMEDGRQILLVRAERLQWEVMRKEGGIGSWGGVILVGSLKGQKAREDLGCA